MKDPTAKLDDDKSSRSKNFYRLMSVAKPEFYRIIVGFSALVMNSITTLSFPWILGKALDYTSRNEGVIDKASEDTVQGVLNANISGVLGSDFMIKSALIFVVGSASSWIRVYSLGTVTDRMASRLRAELFNSFMETDISRYTTTTSGETLDLLERDVNEAASCLTDTLAKGVRSLNSAVNGSIFLYGISPKLCAVTLAIVPPVGVGAMLLSRGSRKLSRQLVVLKGQINTYALERFSNFSTVKLNGMEKFEKDAYAKYMHECNTISEKRFSAEGQFMCFFNLMTSVSLFAVLQMGGGMLTAGTLTPGGLTTFAIRAGFVGLGFSGLSTFYSDMNKSLDAAGRVFLAIDTNKAKSASIASEEQANIVDENSTIDTKTKKINRKLDNAFSGQTQTAIEMINVDFHYFSRPDDKVLSNISIQIQKNKITCFVGKSGAGKSTIAALLCGLYKPTNGLIRVDGNTTDIDESCLMKRVGVVEQSASSLFSGTVSCNIAYGKANATQKEIESAAMKAFAHDFITSLAEGYETEVGVGGMLLSGGQKARIAIARALIKDPTCLIMDEATSSLDAASEQEILEVLTSLKKSKTIILFTHSEAMKNVADVVYSVDEGKLARI